MCNNCINKTHELPDPEDVLNELASDITTKGFVKFRDAVKAMKHFASSATSTVTAENEELKLQLAALTQALETQKRENQPYIKELKRESDTYRIVIEKILLEMEYGTSHHRIPPELFTNVAKILCENDICIGHNTVIPAIGIYIYKQNAAGGVNPERTYDGKEERR